MHEGIEDNLRPSAVPAVQAMMASRLKSVLPPMINKRERLSWYKAIPLSSDPQPPTGSLLDRLRQPDWNSVI